MEAAPEKQKFKSDLFEFISSRCSEVTAKHKGKIPLEDAKNIVDEVIYIFSKKTEYGAHKVIPVCYHALAIVYPPWRIHTISFCFCPFWLMLLMKIADCFSIIAYCFSNKVKMAEKFEKALIKGWDEAIDEIWPKYGDKLASDGVTEQECKHA